MSCNLLVGTSTFGRFVKSQSSKILKAMIFKYANIQNLLKPFSIRACWIKRLNWLEPASSYGPCWLFTILYITNTHGIKIRPLKFGHRGIVENEL